MICVKLHLFYLQLKNSMNLLRSTFNIQPQPKPNQTTQVKSSTSIHQHIGSGGMADTRVVETKEDEDPRKSISAAPSFEEYLKQRDGGGAPAAAAPAAAAPAAAAPAAAAGGGGGDLASTLATLEGPGQVWGHEGKLFSIPSYIYVVFSISCAALVQPKLYYEAWSNLTLYNPILYFHQSYRYSIWS